MSQRYRRRSGGALEHREVFARAHGRLPVPPLTIDHINRDTSDNSISNLRPATWRLQALNQSSSSSRLLPRGVNIDDRYEKRFHVRMWRDGKRRSLGHFATASEASAAYESALAEEIAKEESLSWKLFYEQGENR